MTQDTKYMLPIFLGLGVVVNIGTRGIGYMAHLVVPGLILGAIFYGIYIFVRTVRGG